MNSFLEDLINKGISVDLIFHNLQPVIGDLLLMCGYSHPEFPATTALQFNKLRELNFSQVDDYYGIVDSEGHVIVWLYPLVGNDDVYHHPGPFTGFRFKYSVLRNLPSNKAIILKTLSLFCETQDVDILYKNQKLRLEQPVDLSIIETDIERSVSYLKEKGIEAGSVDALRIPQ